MDWEEWTGEKGRVCGKETPRFDGGREVTALLKRDTIRCRDGGMDDFQHRNSRWMPCLYEQGGDLVRRSQWDHCVDPSDEAQQWCCCWRLWSSTRQPVWLDLVHHFRYKQSDLPTMRCFVKP